jgi:hypothetical protein
MQPSDWIAVLALVVAGGALALEVRRWFESGPRIHLGLMADAIVIPDDDDLPKFALTVTNRGTIPTTITSMVAFMAYSQRQRFFGDFYFTAIVNKLDLPREVPSNQRWTSVTPYSDKISAGRKKGHLYVGVRVSHTDKYFLIRVPPEIKPLPTNRIDGRNETK